MKKKLWVLFFALALVFIVGGICLNFINRGTASHNKEEDSAIVERLSKYLPADAYFLIDTETGFYDMEKMTYEVRIRLAISNLKASSKEVILPYDGLIAEGKSVKAGDTSLAETYLISDVSKQIEKMFGKKIAEETIMLDEMSGELLISRHSKDYGYAYYSSGEDYVSYLISDQQLASFTKKIDSYEVKDDTVLINYTINFKSLREDIAYDFKVKETFKGNDSGDYLWTRMELIR